MISGPAAITLGPPTCGATAWSTPRMSSGVTPTSSALPTCHTYDAGGASIAISAAIFTSENVRSSRPLPSRLSSRRPIAVSITSALPVEIPDSVS